MCADSEDDKRILGHTNVPILVCTSRKEMVEIEIDVVRKIPRHTAHTMEAAKISASKVS